MRRNDYLLLTDPDMVSIFDKVYSLHYSVLSNDPCKVDSNFLCYAATGLSPHRNVIIFTQRMHKPTGRPLMQ